MRTALLVFVALALLALDWAALHDILAGNERDYAWEYGVLMASAGIFAALIVLAVQRAFGRVPSLRTAGLTGTVVLLLVLDWAALHDIVKGNEPSYWMEYAVLWFSGLVFAGLVFLALKGKLLGNHPA